MLGLLGAGAAALSIVSGSAAGATPLLVGSTDEMCSAQDAAAGCGMGAAVLRLDNGRPPIGSSAVSPLPPILIDADASTRQRAEPAAIAASRTVVLQAQCRNQARPLREATRLGHSRGKELS